MVKIICFSFFLIFLKIEIPLMSLDRIKPQSNFYAVKLLHCFWQGVTSMFLSSMSISGLLLGVVVTSVAMVQIVSSTPSNVFTCKVTTKRPWNGNCCLTSRSTTKVFLRRDQVQKKKKVSSIRCVIQQLHTTTTSSSNPKEAQFALCPRFMNILQKVCSMK